MSKRIHLSLFMFSFLALPSWMLSMRRSAGSLVKKNSAALHITADTSRSLWSQVFNKKTLPAQARVETLTKEKIPYWQKEKEEAKTTSVITALTVGNMAGLMAYTQGLPLSVESMKILGGMTCMAALPFAYSHIASYKLRKRIAEKEMLEKKNARETIAKSGSCGMM